ncbi:hypothetical protein G7B40_001210 [Aetokthonos hydrillicola Thurmond2011]|uniref:Uncharacterized protein n=1 Tax=Aetokthonos hydrillicola Thurmond2011 TaxID=2712845 RepID=A0AAP5I1Q5_9CYAN|nr:hypothetical protein [Aetokthonos hydrillicola Thurmond2011]
MLNKIQNQTPKLTAQPDRFTHAYYAASWGELVPMYIRFYLFYMNFRTLNQDVCRVMMFRLTQAPIVLSPTLDKQAAFLRYHKWNY